MAKILKGAPVAKAISADVAARAAALAERGITPTLALVRVGAREGDLSYERAAMKRCAAAGIQVVSRVLPEGCPQEELVSAIRAIDADDAIQSCLLFRPLPAGLDERAACAALDPAKDADGITEGSLYGVFANQPQGFAPCTAEAVMQLLKFYGVQTAGARACVVGRSLVIGRPVAMMLQAADATVTMCHSKTRDVAAACRDADIVVVATGRPDTFGASCATPGQVVVDVGFTWDEDRGAFVGDADFDAVEPIVSAITPVPGGVGSITTACLALHAVEAAERCVS